MSDDEDCKECVELRRENLELNRRINEVIDHLCRRDGEEDYTHDSQEQEVGPCLGQCGDDIR